MDFSLILTSLADAALEALNVSTTACWISLIIMLLRLLMKKAPSYGKMLLWGILGLRLAFPFSVESVLSLIPSKETFSREMVYSNKFSVDTGIEIIDNGVNSALGGAYYEGVTVPSGLKANVLGIFAVMWVIGIVLLLIYYLASVLRLKRKLRTSTLISENVYQSELVDSPFVFGFFRPHIYLPYNVDADDAEYIIMHEKMHIKRCDHLVKSLSFILITFYWFNPLLWICYKMFCRDIEEACDEKAVKSLSLEQKREYSKTLLKYGSHITASNVSPVAFGEFDVKSRIKRIMNYKKPSFWVVIISVLVCVVTALCVLTDPVSKNNDYRVNVDEKLDAAISTAIIENERGKYYGNGYPCEAHVVLANEVGSPVHGDGIEFNTFEVFIIAKYAQYAIENGTLIEESGMVSPLALVFEIDENDDYVLLEYWEPGMGSDYHKSLDKRFPSGVDFSTADYDEYLRTACEEKARGHFGISPSGYDKTFTLSVDYVTLSSAFLPKLSINEEEKAFVFVYDLLSSYLPTGTFEISDGKLTATTYDGKFRFVFDVINNKELRFNESESDTLKVTNKDLSYEIDNGDSFLLGVPKDVNSKEFTTTVVVVGEDITNKPDPIPPYSDDFSDYTLTISKSGDKGIRRLTDEAFRQNNGYSVFTYSLENVYITVGDNKIALGDGIKNGVVGVSGLIEKSVQDSKNGKVKALGYKDGGSTLYVYEDYSIIKLNKLTGTDKSTDKIIKDVFIGPADMSLNDLTDFYTEIY